MFFWIFLIIILILFIYHLITSTSDIQTLIAEKTTSLEKFYKGKTILITGASSGIGESLALKFAQFSDTTLILTARTVDKLEKVKKACLEKNIDCKVILLKLDISDLKEIEHVVEDLESKIKRIDILINNAGISQRSFFLESKWEVLEKIMNTNFFGLVKLTQLISEKYMINQKSGNIVNISSLAGKIGVPLRYAYSSSKFAVQGFSNAIREEMRRDNIFVTLICPGFIQTNVGANALSAEGKSFGENDPNIKNGLSVSRCTDLILFAIASNLPESWISRNELPIFYLNEYLPDLFRFITRFAYKKIIKQQVEWLETQKRK